MRQAAIEIADWTFCVIYKQKLAVARLQLLGPTSVLPPAHYTGDYAPDFSPHPASPWLLIWGKAPCQLA